jgi:hypothetical protein
MAFSSQLDFQHHPPQYSSIDRKPPSSFDDLESHDSLLLESAMLSPTTPADRRDSFGNFFEDEYPNSATTLSDGQYTLSSHPFHEQSHPFRVDSASYGQHASSWSFIDRSGESRHPVAPVTYPVNSELAYADGTSTAPAFGGLQVQSNVQPSAIFPPAEEASAFGSPVTDSKDWMSMAEHAVDTQHLSKRLRNDSPSRPFSPYQKRDSNGIRKKTARFEIPPERTKDNIDELIAKCDDEETVKELKQQKRLLRNRQAAYASIALTWIIWSTGPCCLVW